MYSFPELSYMKIVWVLQGCHKEQGKKKLKAVLTKKYDYKKSVPDKHWIPGLFLNHS